MTGPGRWSRIAARRVQRCRVFDLDEVDYRPPGGRAPRTFYVVDAPDWINVIPVTDRGRVVLVRQFRFGVDDFTLEIPGGMCDPGETPAQTAARELAEETGYAAPRLEPLGWVHPNPALQSNRCHTFLARPAARVGEPRPDPDEAFEIVEEPLDAVDQMIRDGRITHALVVGAFQLLRTRGFRG